MLNEADVRVLGSLIEKAITTPDHYPLSFNALTNACNQTSNRGPVVSYDDATVSAAIDRLRRESLVRAIHRSDSRVTKYQHLAAEKMGLAARASNARRDQDPRQSPGRVRHPVRCRDDSRDVGGSEPTIGAEA